MLMTPGLAFFYGGMVRGKSVLNMMMMSFVTLGVVTLVWVTVGFSLAFGDSHAGLIGGFEHAGLRSTAAVGGETGIPLQAFAMFQLMFAVITGALLSGAIADRARFWP
jgi:Amt family ammonium transporter